jgi:hypothetical protein
MRSTFFVFYDCLDMSILGEHLLHVVKLFLKGTNLGALPSMKQSLTLLLQQDGEISILLMNCS